MAETPERLSARPSWLLTQLAVHAHRLASEGFAEAGARGYHYRILAALGEFGPASQVQLGRRCTMDRSDVVAAINELSERGFVERAPDPGDRRRNIVSLTAAGHQQLRRLDEALDAVQDQLLGPLGAAERATLTHLLARLLEHHAR
ncbi:MarR family transcriptional regulator [Solirubrobacter sp. CPCC 204708]|uniref:MarR family transcriptional regulator n=1 Tax=Solirubrobacter deserti TaxID=2282478 RepID=A0ABT4RLS4_9ACTN|nr:MarR family transcriptional regulator [Solirubrobacter deserti]MBE2320431.1 MarR family transcriptional regulator [Solirubrobacter deserti]MDA0139378.1 MarR family transcriptional regulator [Solirubrobacter deserti]